MTNNMTDAMDDFNDMARAAYAATGPAPQRATPAEIARARDFVGPLSDIAIDDDAAVSRVDPVDDNDAQSPGIWIAAWIWIEDEVTS